MAVCNYSVLMSMLESGNYKEKLHASNDLLKIAENGGMLDAERLVICLISADKPDILYKICLLLSHLSIVNENSRKKLCMNSSVLNVAFKILSSDSIQKSIGILYLITALLQHHEDDPFTENTDKSFLAKTKKKIRATGILNQMCLLFLKCNMESEVWNPLCQCLAECCMGVTSNQNAAYHILPKCLLQLENGLYLNTVNLVISLIHNHYSNQEKFVQLGGIQCIMRNFLSTPKGLELLCVSMTNCAPAVEEARMSNITNSLEDLYSATNISTPSLTQLMISKWCSLAIWILEHFVIENDSKEPKVKTISKKTLNPKFKGKTSMLKALKENFKVPKFKDNIEDTQNTCASLYVTKFDAINYSIPSSVHHKTNKDTVSQYNILKESSKENIPTEIQNISSVFLHNLKSNATGSKCESKANFSLLNESNLNQTMISNNGSFKTFQPLRTSSPLKTPKNLSPDKELFKKPKNYKSLPNNKNQNSNEPSYLDFQEIEENGRDRNTLIPTSSFRVRQLVKKVFDTQNKLNCNEKDKQFHSRPTGFNNYLQNNQENILNGFNIIALNQNPGSSAKTKKDELIVDANTNMESENATTISIESETANGLQKTSCENFKNLSTSKISVATEQDIKNMVKRLKIGISLYGCDFQKISCTLWSEHENVSARYLYSVFQNHIVRK